MAVTQVMVLSRSAKVTVTATETDVVLAPKGRIEGHGDNVIVHGNSDALDVEVPLGSDVVVATSSGRVRCCGSLGSVSVTSGSGKIAIERAASVEVRTASGAISVGDVDGTVGVLTKSGRVDLGSAQRANVTTVNGRITVDSADQVEVNTVSGRVKVLASRTSSVKVRCVSSNVEVSVPAGVAPATSLVTITGRVRCDCDTGSDGDITVKTVSGPITITAGR